MRDNRFKLMVLAASASLALLAPPMDADAAGLGRLTVFSTLGQPLNAEIELLSVQRNETISARLASQDVYQQANAQFNNALTGARVTVEKRANGQLYLKATTPRPISEPFVELLVEINSENGRTVRQYTALLDPPGYGRAAAEIPPPRVETAPETRAAAPAGAPLAPAAPAPSAALSAPPPAAAEPAPAPARRSRAAAPRSETAAAPARTGNPRQYGPIKPGETLGRIARVVKPEGVTLEQTLVGLYRENPEAFIQKNMNLVKSGRILTVPEANELAAVSQPEARKEVRLQTADFNSFRDRLAGRATPAAESGGVTSGRIGTRVADSGSEGPKDTVRLSRGDAKGKAGAAGDRTRALEEEAIARDKALSEANARIAQLEAIIKDSQRAAELKSGAAKGAEKGPEKGAEKGSAIVAAPTAPTAPIAAPLPTPPGKAPEAPLLTTDNILAPPGTRPVDAPLDSPAIVAEAPPAPAPKPEVAPIKKPPEPVLAPEVDVVDTLMSEPLYLAAGAAVLLGGVGLVLARRRRTTDRGTPLNTDDGLVKIPPTAGGTPAAKEALAPTGPTEPKLGTSTPAAPAAKTTAPENKPTTTSSTSTSASAETKKPAPVATTPAAAKPAPGAAPRPAGATGDDNDLDFNVGNPRPTTVAGAAAGTLAAATAGLAAQAGRGTATGATPGPGATSPTGTDGKRMEAPAAAGGLAPVTTPSAGQPVSAPAVPPAATSPATARTPDASIEPPKPMVPPPLEVTSAAAPAKPPANPALNTPLEFDAPRKAEAPPSRATELLKAAQAQRDKDMKPLEMTPAEAKLPEIKTFDAKPLEAKPLDVKVIDSKPTDSKPTDTKPLDTKTLDSKALDVKAQGSQGQDQKAAAAKPLEPLMPDFALDAGGLTLPEPTSSAKAPEQKPADAAKDSNLLDFDLEPLPPIGGPLSMDKVSSEPPAAMDFKLDLADLDIGGNASRNATSSPAPAHDEHWYDVQQKFDLAKAYEEMGDKSGAREILQEVVREGDTAQQEQARKLLGSLS